MYRISFYAHLRLLQVHCDAFFLWYIRPFLQICMTTLLFTERFSVKRSLFVWWRLFTLGYHRICLRSDGFLYGKCMIWVEAFVCQKNIDLRFLQLLLHYILFLTCFHCKRILPFPARPWKFLTSAGAYWSAWDIVHRRCCNRLNDDDDDDDDGDDWWLMIDNDVNLKSISVLFCCVFPKPCRSTLNLQICPALIFFVENHEASH